MTDNLAEAVELGEAALAEAERLYADAGGELAIWCLDDGRSFGIEHLRTILSSLKGDEEMVARRLSSADCIRCWEKEGDTLARMFLCRDCGNKRCPKATDHTLGCTGSNEPGQPGSDY